MGSPYHDRDWLHARYVFRGHTKREIAEECGVSRDTIDTWVSTFGLSREYDDITWLRREHIREGRSASEIGLHLGVAPGAIQRWIDRYNVGARHHDRDWLDQKYIIGRRPLREVAKLAGVHRDTLGTHLERHGLQGRSAYTQAWWLWKHYWQWSESLEEIAELCRQSVSTIRASMQENNIPIRPQQVLPLSSPPPKYKDPVWLYYSYRTKYQSASEISTNYEDVCATLRDYGIEMRSKRLEQMIAHLPERCRPLMSEEWCRDRHKGDRWPVSKIATYLSSSQTTVQNWLEYHGIEIDGLQPSELRDKEWLVQQYCGNDLTAREIAKELRCHPKTAVSWLSHHQIPLDDDVPLTYGPNWRPQRKRALNRDGHRCQSCGMTEEEHLQSVGIRLDVHHIEPIRECVTEDGMLDFGRAHRLNNLVTLCRTCHREYDNQPEKARRLISGTQIPLALNG